MVKHFILNIEDGAFSYERNEASIRQHADLDGIYIIRASESQKCLTSENTLRSYKNLSKVEQLFRTLNGIDISVPPIRHRLSQQVNSHIFICMLAYYV